MTDAMHEVVDTARLMVSVWLTPNPESFPPDQVVAVTHVAFRVALELHGLATSTEQRAQKDREGGLDS